MTNKKKNKYPLLENVRIEGLAAEGNSVTHLENGLALFVPFVAPGDLCTVQVVRKKRNYWEGRATEILEYSPQRAQPLCKHFGICGGCRWQHIPYETQLQAKEKQVEDTLKRIGKIVPQEQRPIVAYHPKEFPYQYRNKVEFTFSNRKWRTTEEMLQFKDSDPDTESKEYLQENSALGFHIPKFFDKVLPIEHCHLCLPIVNQIRNFLFEYCKERIDRYPFYDLRDHHGVMRTLVIRTTTRGDLMVVLALAQDNPEERSQLLDDLLQAFPQITSLYYVINTKLNDSLQDLTPVLYHGNPVIYEQLGELTYLIGPKSFFQTNSTQAKLLYDVVLSFAEPESHQTVYDLYTGAGTIAHYLAPHVAKVVGIEYVPEAVEDAYQNQSLNHTSNTFFTAGDMKDILTESFIATHGTPHIIVTDPPRAGMHPSVIEAILFAAPERIVYVSCNPATQARDLELLTSAGNYRVTRSQAVDMFPHTQHVENVVLLQRVL